MSALSGVVILILFLPLQRKFLIESFRNQVKIEKPFPVYLGKRTSLLRFETARRTDKRVQLMNEVSYLKVLTEIIEPSIFFPNMNGVTLVAKGCDAGHITKKILIMKNSVVRVTINSVV